ncbi:MAG TPA: flagellar biosynthesis protein FlhB [Clostridiales bacterium]|nr:flagellar biosynthesis protein FlhB [Clostridiales bacterium]
MPSAESRTEKATPKKRRDERKKGNVFQSKDIASSLCLLTCFIVLKLIFPYIFLQLDNLYSKCVGLIRGATEVSETFLFNVLKDTVLVLVICTGPVMLTSVFVNIVATGAQTRFLFSSELIKPKFSRLSPINGIRGLFSLRSAIELMKSLIKVVVIGYCIYDSVKDVVNYFERLVFFDLKEAVVFVADTIMDMIIQMSIAFITIAALDYLYQWWEYERNLRMTKQEVKEEFKHLEGDPQIKGRIRERQRKMALSRMMQQVPKADVIIRNPTHYAVALRYDSSKDAAPVVIAKGKDHVALKIIEIAEKHDIPMTENKPLAKLLYDTVELNMEVPAEFYEVLAEILAWVYKLKNKESR